MTKIAVASDHAGFLLKKQIVSELQNQGLAVLDLGCESEARVDYTDYAARVSEAVQAQKAQKGILICGTGIGMALTANRFAGIRAACVSDVYSAQMAREHNDANVLCLGARVVGDGLAGLLVKTFLQTPFAGGRHAERVQKIHNYDKK